MLKILHIIDDDKFIDLLLPRYFFDGCENEIVYIKDECTYKGKYRSIVRWVLPFSKKLEDVFSEPSKFNIIIVYSLNNSKALFVNSIQHKPVIIWHFFGTEIYNKTELRKYNYSAATSRMITANTKPVLKASITKVKVTFRRIFNSNDTPQSEIDKAMLACDYFLWYNKDEYDYLKSHLPILPEFLQLPVTTIYPEPDYSAKDKLKMLVGNSSAPGNNHIDTFSQLQELQYKGEVIVPFGYGYDAVYKKNLLRIIKDLTLDVHVLGTFMPYEAYLHLLDTVTTAVFNSYRQMALGNIFMLLFYGAKIYLSERNPTYPWLKKLGFHIYSTEQDLEAGLKSGDLKLDKAQMLHNKALYVKMANKACLDNFIQKLPELVKTR